MVLNANFNNISLILWRLVLLVEVKDSWQISGFLPGTLVSNTNKTVRHDIAEKHHTPNPLYRSIG
jgi:hypothetical protein